VVRREWGAAVCGAASGDTTNIDAALALFTTIENGLTTMRPNGSTPRPPQSDDEV